MKLLYILISLSLVGRVLVTKLDDYIQLVLTINEDMKDAKELLPEIIKNIVLNDVYGMEIMAFMLAVPDLIECELLVPNYEYQNPADQNKIQFKNPVPGEGTSQDRIPVINLDPEEENPRCVTIIHFEDKLEIQKLLEAEIANVVVNGPGQNDLPDLNVDPPTVSAEDPMQTQIRVPFPPIRPGKKRIDEPAVKLENLASLLEERRRRTAADLRNHRIIRTFNLTELARARREMTLEAITKLLRQNNRAFRSLQMMCRLVGAFRSIKYPQSYVDYADYSGEYCVLMDISCKEMYVYKFINGEFWKVDSHPDYRLPIRPFLSEL